MPEHKPTTRASSWFDPEQDPIEFILQAQKEIQKHGMNTQEKSVAYIRTVLDAPTNFKSGVSRMNYVLCIAQNSLGYFIVVKKQSEDWQKGLYNFPGGKIELGESYHFAAAREFYEETGQQTLAEQWELIATLESSTYSVLVVTTDTACDDVKTIPNPAGETIHTFNLEEINANKFLFVHNLPWLAALSLDLETPMAHAVYM
jgi:8-oxo-dGTP pyrophosphatase MutT (NUDIX family)